MGIRVKGKLPQLTKGFEKALGKELDQATADGIAQMQLRTQKGKDRKLRTFARYTEEYAKLRTARGRKSSPVDLLFTGKMLGSITYKQAKNGSTLIREVFFNSAEEARKALGNLKKRDFFGFDKNIIKKLEQRINNKIKELLNK